MIAGGLSLNPAMLLLRFVFEPLALAGYALWAWRINPPSLESS